MHKKGYKDSVGYELKDIILGGQDGLVNVLGLVLGVAAAVNDARIVIISGLAATFAESLSMAAVAYTSTKAAKEFYQSQLEKEQKLIEKHPAFEQREVRHIFLKKGFRGRLLDQVLRKITSSKRIWLDTLMAEELKMYPEEYGSPLKSGVVVGVASFIGSLIPLFPFFLLDIKSSMIVSLILSVIMLFIIGALKAKITVGSWKRSGIELALIGTAAAMGGYLIGKLLGKI